MENDVAKKIAGDFEVEIISNINNPAFFAEVLKHKNDKLEERVHLAFWTKVEPNDAVAKSACYYKLEGSYIGAFQRIHQILLDKFLEMYGKIARGEEGPINRIDVLHYLLNKYDYEKGAF